MSLQLSILDVQSVYYYFYLKHLIHDCQGFFFLIIAITLTIIKHKLSYLFLKVYKYVPPKYIIQNSGVND